MKKLALILIILFIVGCGINHTVKYTTSPPTIIPLTLSAEDVEFVVLLSLVDLPTIKEKQKECKVEVGVENRVLGIAEIIVKRMFGGNRQKPQYWHYEGKMGEGVIYAGFHHKKVYMQVEIKYDRNRINFKIIDSRNLQQSEERIHKHALVWLNMLERDIRANLGKYDRIKGDIW